MSDAQDDKPELIAGRHWPSHLRLWLVAAVAAAADLVTKQLAYDLVGTPPAPGLHGGEHTVIEGFFAIETIDNPNAAMGLDARIFAALAGLVCLVTAYGAIREKGRRRVLYALAAVVAAGFAVAALIIGTTLAGEAATQAQRWLFVGVMSVIGLVFVGMFWLSRPRQWATHVALGLVIGGDVGNLCDRIGHGTVRDFLRFTLPVINKDYPSFNLADAFLVIGVGLLILTRVAWMVREAKDRKKAGTRKAPSQSAAKARPRRRRS